MRADRSQLGEEVRILYRKGVSAIWANFAAVVAFVAVAYSDIALTWIVVWAVAVSTVLCARYVLIGRRLAAPEFPAPASRRGVEFAVGSTLTGLVFAVGFIAFVPHLSDYERSLMIVSIAGMCAGGALSQGSYAPAYYGYASTLFVPPIVYGAMLLVRDPSLVAAAETCILLAYFSVMFVLHAGGRRFIRESIRLQLDNAELVSGLKQTNLSLSRDRDELTVAAFTDALTGIANRRRFDQTLAARWLDGVRERSPLGCLLIDIDYFKRFNDRYGHDAGDSCLQRVAQTLSDVVHREVDCAARYGGEEFVVLLPNTGSAGALYVGELIRQEINDLKIRHEDSPLAVVTISVGATSVIPSADCTPEGLIKRADEALYAAKEHGRNRVQLLRSCGEVTADSGP
ncbi:MAG: diguanylate cyclase domain-containing protein [Gammaproteobacteria bacterium]